MNKIREKITRSHLVSAFSLFLILFLIFFSQYLKKEPVKLEINSENTPAEEQTLSPINEPADSAGEAGTAADAQGEEENKNAESGDLNEDAAREENTSTDVEKKELPRDDLIIGIIADAHSGQEYGFSRLGSATWSLNNYVAPNIVVDLGDLIESRLNYKSIKKSAAIEDYKRASYLISRYFPVYHVIGNHEVLSLSKADIQNLTGRKNYFSVKINGYNIIILDSNYNKNETSVDAKHADNFIYDGALPEKQVGWLENQVKNNNNNIIFVHHPFYELTNRSKVEDIIKENKKRIILIANGHKHPKVLGVSAFGGVKNYEIPSTQFQKAYAVIRINGSQATVTSRKFMN